MNTSTKSKNKTTKYRPVLTSLQITHILHLAKAENPLSDLSLSVVSTLSVFQTKIENAAVLPAYSSILSTATKEEKQLLDLGGTPIESASTALVEYREQLTKEESWELCYAKYLLNPDSCSIDELEAAMEHMYLHDLMTPAQEAAYENKAAAAAEELD